MPDAKSVLIDALEQAFRRRSWHGTNLLGSLRGTTAEEATWRPAAGRHNVWEQALHAAYWKYSVRRRLAGAEKGSFPLAGSNWFARPVEATASAWKADVNLLKDQHEQLLSAVRACPAARLGQTPAGSGTTFQDLILGAAAHDLYHAGQINLIKRLRG